MEGNKSGYNTVKSTKKVLCPKSVKGCNISLRTHLLICLAIHYVDQASKRERVGRRGLSAV